MGDEPFPFLQLNFKYPSSHSSIEIIWKVAAATSSSFGTSDPLKEKSINPSMKYFEQDFQLSWQLLHKSQIN